ncbi:phage neck terminator protein, partial [Burkholderia multivorans]
DTYIRHQDIDVLCTFYGPRAKGYAQRLADGLAIPQNREQLQLQDMAFVGVGAIRPVPDFVNQQWVRRYDMTVTLRRKITRTYSVLNLKSATVATTTDSSTPVAGVSNIHS